MLYGFLGVLSRSWGQGAQGQDWEESWGERGTLTVGASSPTGAHGERLAGPWGCCLGPGRPRPLGKVLAHAVPPASGPPARSPGLAPRSPSSSRRCRGRMRAAGVSRLWRINIPGTSPRPPAHAEENITAISGGSSACTQYLDGEFGVINLALSSSLRGPRGSGMFGMGKKLASAAVLQGALWGSARAAAVPRAGCGPLMAPPGGQITPHLWPSAACQWMRVCSAPSPPGAHPGPSSPLQPPLFRPSFQVWPHCTSRRLSLPQFPHL